jgi:hypothetical protein
MVKSYKTLGKKRNKKDYTIQTVQRSQTNDIKKITVINCWTF